MSARIALDLDGVVYDWGGTVRYLIEQHHGIVLEESTHWTYVQDNVPPHVWRWLWKEGVEEHGLFRYGKLYKGAIDGIKTLAGLGKLEVVTHRPRSALKDTLRFVENLPDVFHGVHILTEQQPKSSVGCDVYIDDNPAVFDDVLAAGKRAVVVDRLWNEALPGGISFNAALDGNLVRAYGWDDVPVKVAGLIRGAAA
jgi:hypothetical protein